MRSLDLKLFLVKLIEVIGVTSGVVTILLAFWSNFPEYIKGKELNYFSYLIGINLAIALIRVKPKNRINLKITDTVSVSILFDDLFEQAGIIAIPVNEYFDTIVDDRIISSSTLHGKFIKNVFGGNEENLRKQIRKSLSNVKPIEINQNRNSGNKEKYELGTVAQVENNGKIYYLFVLTRFNKNNRAEISKEEYQRSIQSLFDYTHQFSQGKKVNIPLIGAGHSGVKLSKQKLLKYLLFSLELNDNLTLVGGVNLILDASVKKEVNLNKLQYLYNLRGE